MSKATARLSDSYLLSALRMNSQCYNWASLLALNMLNLKIVTGARGDDKVIRC